MTRYFRSNLQRQKEVEIGPRRTDTKASSAVLPATRFSYYKTTWPALLPTDFTTPRPPHKDMALICIYSHPEIQITQGLLRQTRIAVSLPPSLLRHGIRAMDRALFADGLLWLSMTLNRSFHLSDTNGKRKIGISNDPAIEATDVLVHTIKLSGTEHLAL